MARALKEMLIAGYGKDLAGSPNVIVFDPGNMTVEKTREFRRDLREKAGGAKVRIVHNSTARRAFGSLWGAREKALDDVLVGPSAVVVGGSGPGAIARVLRDWKKKHKPLRVKGGVAEGEVLDGKGVEALADLPGLPELRAMLLAAVNGPARGLAVVLSAGASGLARATKARIDKGTKEGGGFAADAGAAAPEAAAPEAPAASTPETGGAPAS
jgi:large subunit ribosomal protein L10